MSYFQANSQDDDLELAIDDEMQRVRMASLSCAPPSWRGSDGERGAGKIWLSRCLLAGQGTLDRWARCIRQMAAALDELAWALRG